MYSPHRHKINEVDDINRTDSEEQEDISEEDDRQEEWNQVIFKSQSLFVKLNYVALKQSFAFSPKNSSNEEVCFKSQCKCK